MDDLRSFLASQDFRGAVKGRDHGVILRLIRRARGLTQTQAGQLAGYSAATISRFETGARHLSDIETLRRLAAALNITPEIFGLTADVPETLTTPRAASPPRAPALTTVVTGLRQDGDPVRRRELLTSVTGLSAAVLLPVPRVSPRTGPDPVIARLEEILTGHPAPAVPAAARVLEARLAAAWQAFNSCHYQALARQLPALVSAASASRDEAAGHSKQACCAALADAYILVSELAQKAGEDGMSWVASDRALTAARDSADPATIAAASRAVAIAMRRLGHYDAATTMLTSTALSLDADHGSPPAATLAAYGSLLCTAAYASAQNGQRHQALDLISEATATASRMGDTTAGRSMFSRINVEVYQIGIHTALGDSAGALDHARAVSQPRLPTSERRARFCIDTARAWQQHGRPDQAGQALLVAERQSPEEIRRPSVKALITTIIQAPGTHPNELRQLAERAGAST
jgi:transcriptional regulator with XRE-family HTH domain